MPPKKLKKSAVERDGVNFVRSVVEHANCIFQEIDRHNDFGNDAILELVENESVRGICLALQIKSGESYSTSDACVIPSNRDHWEYWSKHSLPVIGIVYDPSEALAYWTDITRTLRSRYSHAANGPYALRFLKTEINRFNEDGFRTFFLPQYLNRPVQLPREQAARFAASDSPDLQRLGLQALLTGYRDQIETWDLLIGLFGSGAYERIDPYLIYILSLVPGHMDIGWHSGNILDQALRTRLHQRFAKFEHDDVIKLLAFIDENGFQRGSLGQSVTAIVSLVDGKTSILKQIVEDAEVETEIRRDALILLTHYSPEIADSTLWKLSGTSHELSSTASDLKEQLQTFGFIYIH